MNTRVTSKSLKAKTIFCDIDGTILKHQGNTKMIILTQAEALPGVVTKINEWEVNGHKIIITTARRESLRAETEKQLQSLGIPYDSLLMGITSGYRVLINDKTTLGDDSAFAINLQRNKGFDEIKWADLGL
jgi:hydroxymethylpyrimidine pyrophosphatase-like HAD family hydrolase